jgi:hypothetical protein
MGVWGQKPQWGPGAKPIFSPRIYITLNMGSERSRVGTCPRAPPPWLRYCFHGSRPAVHSCFEGRSFDTNVVDSSGAKCDFSIESSSSGVKTRRKHLDAVRHAGTEYVKDVLI